MAAPLTGQESLLTQNSDVNATKGPERLALTVSPGMEIVHLWSWFCCQGQGSCGTMATLSAGIKGTVWPSNSLLESQLYCGLAVSPQAG